MSTEPHQNQQFGKTIGVDDVSPPMVEHGQRVAQHSDIVQDGRQGVRARFSVPLKDPPPPEEASAASERGEYQKQGAPVGEVGLIPDEPSVWESVPEGEEDLR